MAHILCFPFGAGPTLAHVASCIAVGDELRARGHEVTVAACGDHTGLVEASGLSLVPVTLSDWRRIAGNVGRMYSSVEELVTHAHDDGALIDRLQPDAIVIDYRASALLAAAVRDVPAVSIMHFLRVSKFRRMPIAQRLRENRQPVRFVAAARRSLARDVDGARKLTAEFAEARARDWGSPPPVRRADATLVACTTTPLLDPTVGLPDHWRYVGPITWSAPAPDAEPIERGSRPLVYVTQGSTGSPNVLRRTVAELARDPVDVIVTTGPLIDPRELEALAPNVRAAEFLPGRACLEAADVAVVHGGHLTTSQAHAAGTPVIVLPHVYDQWAWSERVVRFGTGVVLERPLLPGAIRRAVRRILGDERYRLAAEALGNHLAAWNGAQHTADLVEQLAGDAAAPGQARLRRGSSLSSDRL